MTKKKGNRASREGELLERQTLDCIRDHGHVEIYSYEKFRRMEKNVVDSLWPRTFVVKGVPICRVWNVCGFGGSRGGITEYVLFHRRIQGEKHTRIRVECKYQQSSGSTINKIFMAIVDLKYFSPSNEEYGIIVVDGEQFIKRFVAMENMTNFEINFDPKTFRLNGAMAISPRVIPSQVFIFTLKEWTSFIDTILSVEKSS